MVADMSREEQRLEALEKLELLDTVPEEEFDELVEIAAAVCGTPISTITLVDRHRQWFKSVLGLDSRETPRELSFCSHAIEQPSLFVVEDAQKDARFADNALVTGEPWIRFYAGFPLTAGDGQAVGTLCVIDRQPRKLTSSQRRAIEVLARQVQARMELRAQRRALEETLRQREMLLANLQESQAELEEANSKLLRLAQTDALTGLPNRRVFDERLAVEISTAKRHGRDLAVALLDIDNFKKVNDTLGHAIGDVVLKLLARALDSTVRLPDLAARYGGEEFIVLLPESNVDQALQWSKRFRQALADTRFEHGRITVSMGIAQLQAGLTAHQMVEAADDALYVAKRGGKDAVAAAQRDLPPRIAIASGAK